MERNVNMRPNAIFNLYISFSKRNPFYRTQTARNAVVSQGLLAGGTGMTFLEGHLASISKAVRFWPGLNTLETAC